MDDTPRTDQDAPKSEGVDDNSSSVEDPLPLGVGFYFDTKFHEQTGLLEAYNFGLERFQPERGIDFETQTYRKYYTRSDAVPKPGDESGWEGQQDGTVYFKEEVDVKSLAPQTPIHILFHFHDNYCDVTSGFLDRDKAECEFRKREQELVDRLEEFRQWNSDVEFVVVKRDPWHCDLLECELTGRPYHRCINLTDGLTRPDKGNTWWLRTVVLG